MALKHTFKKNDVTILEKNRVFDGHFAMDKYTVQHPLFAGGVSQPFTREIFERGNAVCVLLYDPVLEVVVLTEQFRIGALDDARSPWLFEIVAGVIDEGETPETVAHREAQEEAGCKIKELIYITRFYVSPGGTSEAVYVYCGIVDATDAGGVHGLAEENEDIKVHVVPCAEAFEAVKTGLINNSVGIIALQWLELHRFS